MKCPECGMEFYHLATCSSPETLVTPSGVWVREDGSVMLPMNQHRASIRERLQVIRLGWRACHNIRLTLFMIWLYLRPSAQVCDYEKWSHV